MEFTEPRFLTLEEIDEIVNVVPMVQSTVSEAGEVLRQEIKISLARQMEELKLCPEEIPTLKKWIVAHAKIRRGKN